MSDEPKESKAQKLAAARKKLKEYQKRGTETTTTTTAMSAMSTSTTSVASSEKSDFDINTSDTPKTNVNVVGNASSFFETQNQETAFEEMLQQEQQQVEQQLPVSSFFTIESQSSNLTNGSNTLDAVTKDYQQSQQQQQQQHQQHMNAMQLLINEKMQLTAELSKYRNTCYEQSTELEDLRSQLSTSTQQTETLQQNCQQYQQSQSQLSKQNAELMHKLSQVNAQQEDQAAHLAELQQQLKLVQNQSNQLEQKYNEKCKECELALLRIQQISNEPNASNDNRVEALTQNKFMYEQQIRDLQAMVQQFAQDKEQSSAQYQNYVQHLNVEVNTLNDRNSELTDECTKLQERERQLVEHISELEKELQKHLNQRKALSENQQTPQELESSNEEINVLRKQIEEFQERISDFEFERHEFQLKIKSQEDRLQELQQNLTEKEEQLERISQHMADQPDQMLLLATMESDKVAASRALTQNVELKKQLDELEYRFVQLTNDKAELTNKLDAEEFANREMRANYASMEERVHSLDERFQFKDAEMIRLSHENMELTQQISLLEQQLHGFKEQIQESKSTCSHEDHNEVHNTHDSSVCNGGASEHCETESTETTKLIENHKMSSESDSCEEACEKTTKNSSTLQIATAEAVEKLQKRFTKLISQVADLTDEKQRLEHLVLQLQGETETIGEYIALYQTQRRILKQREYEKAAQARLLQEEREILRDKIGQLNQLVSRLGFLEQTTTTDRTKQFQNENADDIKSQLNAALAESIAIEPQNHDNDAKNSNYIESQEIFDIPETNEILMKIQNIVTEIRENTNKEMPLTVDHCHCCEGQLKVV